jgi:hypothetical protein
MNLLLRVFGPGYCRICVGHWCGCVRSQVSRLLFTICAMRSLWPERSHETITMLGDKLVVFGYILGMLKFKMRGK